jgi:tetratricopeptide (TPR) repeat protein
VLVRCEWREPDAQLHGRPGQEQEGVDIYLPASRDGKLSHIGFQCKLKQGGTSAELTEKEVQEEVRKAKSFEPKLTHLFILTTAPNDKKIQAFARKLTETHRKEDLFDVSIWGWEQIEATVSQHPEAIRAFLPDAFPMFDRLLEAVQGLAADQRDKFDAVLHEVRLLRTSYQSPHQPAQDTSSSRLEAVDLRLHGRIDQCRDLIRAGRPAAARAALDLLRTNDWAAAQHRARFRITTNLGAAAIALGDTEAASNLFLEAFGYDPKDQVALANRALAYLLKEKRSEARQAADEAIAEHPNFAVAHAYRLQTAEAADEFSRLIAEVPASVAECSEVALAAAQVARRFGLSDQHQAWLSKAWHQLNERRSEVAVPYSALLLEEAFKDRDVRLGAHPRGETANLLEQGIAILQEQRESARRREHLPIDVAIAVNLANALHFSGQTERALAVLDEEVAAGGPDPEVLGIRAHFRFIDGDAAGCLADLDKLMPLKDGKQRLLRATALRQSNQIAEAIRALEELRADPSASEIRSHILSDLVDCLVLVDDLDAAETLARNLAAQDPKIIEIQLPLHGVLLRQGKREEAASLLDRCLEQITDETPVFQRYLLASELRVGGRPSKAADLLDGKIDIKRNSEPVRLLLRCAIESDRRNLAKAIFDNLDTATLALSFYRRAQAQFLTVTGDLSTAKGVLEAHVASEVNDVNALIDLVHIYLRTADHESACKLLISRRGVHRFATPTQKMQFAWLLDRVANDAEALEIAFDALRSGIGNPQIQLRFLGLMLSSKNAQCLTAKNDVIDVNYAFDLDVPNDGMRTYVILNEPNLDPTKGEIGPANPLAVRAIGRRQGDIVAVPGSDKEGRIVGIRHKCVDAVQRIQTHFEATFPGNHGLRKVDLNTGSGDPSVEPILEEVKRHSQARLNALAMWRRQSLPLGVLSSITGSDLVTAYTALLKHGERIACCVGVQSEREQAVDVIEKSIGQGCIIDPLTLDIVFQLNLVDVLMQLFGWIGTPQVTLDGLVERREELRVHEGQEVMTIWWEDGKYYRNIRTADDVTRSLTHLNAKIESVKKICRIVPAIGTTLLTDDQRETLAIIGRESGDTLLAADGSGALLICEDMALRRLGSELLSIKAVWLQVVLLVAKDRGLIELERYVSAIANLIDAKHHFITVDGGSLTHAWITGGWKASRHAELLTSALSAPSVEPKGVVRITAGTLIDVWRLAPTYLDAERVSFQLFERVLNGNPKNAIRLLAGIAVTLLERAPSNGRKIVAAMQKWFESHFLSWPPAG